MKYYLTAVRQGSYKAEGVKGLVYRPTAAVLWTGIYLAYCHTWQYLLEDSPFDD